MPEQSLKNLLTPKEKELLEKLKEASKPLDYFTLELKFNGKNVIAKKDFSAEKYTPETIEKTRLHFMITDFVREIQKELRKNIEIKEN